LGRAYEAPAALLPFFLSVVAEDKLMGQQFPNEYPAYEKRTKALIPFIW
jgi:protein-S-isoprenylcysteine O-methyltransferase Ste14